MKKRILSLCMVAALLFGMLPNIALCVRAETIASGTSKEGFHWELDGEGTLTLSGEGQMADYYSAGDVEFVSWLDANLREHIKIIKKVIINPGITRVGRSAFAFCDMTSVELPDTVESIGDDAFLCCENLKTIVIPNSVTTIGGAFRQSGLTEITIPPSVAHIDRGAFWLCEDFKTITFEGNPPVIGNEFGQEIFEAISITAYYPQDNPTWTVDVMQNYGGILTWVPKEGYENTNPVEESPSLFIPVVESRIVECKFDSLSAEKQQECRGILFDLDSDGNNELILRYLDRWDDLIFEVWKIQNGTPNCINTVNLFSGGIGTNGCLSSADYEGKQYLVYQWINSGMDYVNDLSEVYCLTAGKYEYTSSVSVADLGKLTTLMRSHYDIDKDEEPEGTVLDELIEYLSTIEITSNDEVTKSENSLVIYSDYTYTNLSISTGSTITLSAGILVDGELNEDISGITFQIGDTSILDVLTTDTKNNCRYVKLKGLKEGTTTVVFSDSNLGDTVEVPITVYDNNYHSYTLNNIPTQQIEKYESNFYNVNGLYIDSYAYTVNDDQSATVSFDVYNTNYIHGAVEVYDQEGNMTDAVLIEKMSSSNTSIKEAVWDNLGYLVRDIIDGDLLSYRQESGYSQKTSVSVKIPKNGYIKICIDPENSLIVGLINSVDILMSMASLAGDIKDFDVNSKEFSEKLTLKLVTDTVYVELLKDGNKASEKLWKKVGKETLITSESMGNFADTICKNIDELNLGSLIADTAESFGWSIGEKVFTYFSGPCGTALTIMFTIGKTENLIIQQNDLIQSAGVGSIYIQNQGGGLRSCQQIKVESEDEFSSDIALNVFSVTFDSTFLDIIEDLNPEVYEAMTNGITYTYNISLLKNGDETQPDGKVTVYIPIPEDLTALAYAGELTGGISGKVKIYRVEEDGNLTEMDVEIEDGCFVFTTDHFSLYTIVGYDSGNDATQNQEGNSISTIAIMGLGVVIIAGVGATIFIKKKKK